MGLEVLPVVLMSQAAYVPLLFSIFTSERFEQLQAAYQNECFNEYANQLLKEWWLLCGPIPMIICFVMSANFMALMIISIATKAGSKFLGNTLQR